MNNLGFRLKTMFANDTADPKYVSHLRSDQNWSKNNHFSTLKKWLKSYKYNWKNEILSWVLFTLKSIFNFSNFYFLLTSNVEEKYLVLLFETREKFTVKFNSTSKCGLLHSRSHHYANFEYSMSSTSVFFNLGSAEPRGSTNSFLGSLKC